MAIDDIQVVVDNSAESIRKRLPMGVDGIQCACGGIVFRLGIAEASKACPFCGKLMVAQCLSCASWLCGGCMVEKAVESRKERGVDMLYSGSEESSGKPS
jgi:hypothetical protein